MEEEKRKKKNKKKKGKQTKTSEDVTVAGGETRSVEQNHIEAVSEQNHRTHILEDANVQLAGASDSDAKQSIDHINGARDVTADEVEKQLWLQREADLEKRIIDLQHEKDSWLREKAIIEGKIERLLHERSNWILKEASFDDRIKQLERERESWISKENSNKEAIARIYEENLEALTQVKALQESRDSIFQENQRLMGSISVLQESRESIFQENQQLMGGISVLQSQIQQFEKESYSSASSMTKMHVSEVEDINAQLEAASLLVEKLITENAELVEKVNELYIELTRQSKVVEHSSMARHDPMAETYQATPNNDYMFELKERMPESSKQMEYQTVDQTKNENISIDQTNYEKINGDDANSGSTVLTGIPDEEDAPGSYEAGETEEIVQIPLDENEIREVELHAEETNEKVGVPLSDAPLTGAPFRLISFVARYVSGADLVDKKASNSGR